MLEKDFERVMALVSEINHAVGEEIIIRLGPEITDFYKERTSTGSLGLDCVTGGGLPRGLIQYIGTTNAGKTSMSFKAIAECQKKYGDKAKVAYFSLELPMDKAWALKHGVILNNNFVLVENGSSGEVYLETLRTMINSNEFDIIVLDSVPALVSKGSLERDLGDEKVAQAASLITAFVGRCIWSARKLDAKTPNKTRVLITNQYRAKIGGYSPNGVPARKQYGAEALQYAKIIDVEFSGGEKISEGVKADEKREFGKVVRYKVLKGKVGCHEGGTGTFDFYTENHDGMLAGQIDVGKEYRVIGAKYDVLTKAGAYFKYEDKSYRREELENLVREDEGFREELKCKILKAAGIDLSDEKLEEKPKKKTKGSED